MHSVATTIQIVPLSELLLRGMERIPKIDRKMMCEGVGFESKGEGEVDCEGTAIMIDRGVLRLRLPIKDTCGGIVCLNALTKPCSWRTQSSNSQRMTWNWMGGSMDKTMKIHQMKKLAELARRQCTKHIRILFCSLIYCFWWSLCFYGVCSRANHSSMGIFSLPTIGHAMSNWGARWDCWEQWP